jgi:hypothetical protein
VVRLRQLQRIESFRPATVRELKSSARQEKGMLLNPDTFGTLDINAISKSSDGMALEFDILHDDARITRGPVPWGVLRRGWVIARWERVS